MNIPKDCRECGNQGCKAWHYGGTHCKYEKEIYLILNPTKKEEIYIEYEKTTNYR